MDEVPQRRPGPPRSSSCPAKLPPIWGVLWAFFLLLQPPGRPRLRRRSRGPPPWCGAAAAEVSETEPGLEKAAQEAKAMAIATSVSPPGKGGCGLLASTVYPALLSLLSLPSLCLSPWALSPPGGCVQPPTPNHFCFSFSLSSSPAPSGSRLPLLLSSPPFSSFLSRGYPWMEGRGQA